VPTPLLKYGFLSSTPPTACGVATFAMALGATLVSNGSLVSVVRVTDTPEPRPQGGLEVVADLVASDPASIDDAVAALNKYDVVVLQHEYGLYGGTDGDAFVRIVERLHVPTIAILHTVSPHPTPGQVRVLNDIIKEVDVVVVMSETAAATLRVVNDNPSTPVLVIPHGAITSPNEPDATRPSAPLLLTWGLLGPGKGIEWMIDAMALLRDRGLTPTYTVAGATHPKVRARDGEQYRDSLIARVKNNDLESLVHFDDVYRDRTSLQELIHTASVVVLPYDSKDQATSGVLVEAIAAGVPVVATAFPHATEILGSGAGVVVDHKDASSLASALYTILTSPPLLRAMELAALQVASTLDWQTVAEQYQDIATSLVSEPRSALPS
jgi:polysaccharide biosynthesis protein PslF